MSGALNGWRQAVAAQLQEAGLNAVAAMEPARAPRWRAAAAAVSLARVVCAPGGFKDYLGTWTDPDTGKRRELYGREAELTLALDIFAPRDGGEGVCQTAAEAAMEELACRGAVGLDALELQAGQVEFLEREGLYRQKATCRCRAWLVARTEDAGGAFTDFEVRGSMR